LNTEEATFEIVQEQRTHHARSQPQSATRRLPGAHDQPVEITASLDDTPRFARDAGAAEGHRERVAAPTVTLKTRGGPQRTPSFSHQPAGREPRPALRRFADGPRIHFAGAGAAAGRRLPAQGGRGRARADPRLDGDFEFEVYVSLTCHNCPDVVQALNLMAIQNPRIKTTMIEGGLFQDEVEERQIMGVPTVFLNGTMFGSGPHEPGRDPRQARHRRRRARSREDRRPRTRSTC
jgi:alkyl hydroperoxide reductase subunit F